MIGWTEKEIFTKEFLKLDYHHISGEIKKNGFFCFDKALNNSFLDSIENDVKKSGISLNTNGIAGVYYSPGKQFFLTHMLAVSKSFFDFVTLLLLRQFIDRPMHFFGKFGLFFTLFGLIINIILTYEWIYFWFCPSCFPNEEFTIIRPLFFLGILLIVIGVQFFSIGFIKLSKTLGSYWPSPCNITTKSKLFFKFKFKRF